MNPSELPVPGFGSSELSLISLFLQAHWLVEVVMVVLMVCSVVVWWIAYDKFRLFARRHKEMDQIEQALNSGDDALANLHDFSSEQPDSVARVFAVAFDEWERSREVRAIAGLQM